MKIEEQARLWARKHRDVSIESAFVAGYKYCIDGSSRPVEQREEEFAKIVFEYSDTYPVDMLDRFVRYWTERNPNGRKMRYEKEKVFDVERRLKTWYERSSNNQQYRVSAGQARGSNSIFDLSDSVLQTH